MAEKTAKKGMPVFIGVAMVWMGTHFGPGVASGTQINVYYTAFGIAGILCSIVAMGILAYALYCSMEFSRIYKTYDYQSWMHKIFGVKWVGYLFDICFLVTCLTALGGSLNAVGVLLNNMLGLNYWIGVVAIIILAMLLCAFGSNIVRNASSYLMFIVLGVLALIVIMVIAFGDHDLAGAVANQATNLPKSTHVGQALWQAVIYACFQATVVANISSVADGLKKRSDSKKAAVFGFAFNALVLVVMSLMLFSYTNVKGFESGSIVTEALPIYSILDRLGFQWLTIVYVIVVFIAVLSTAIGFCFGGVARFSKIYNRKNTKNKLKDALFVGILLACCAVASRLGILTLVSVGYTILGYLNLPIVVIPAIFLGGRKIRKKYLEAHKIEAPGIDE